ncbi:MAG TPA: ribonuclease H-like domain-containing protein [Candidatus Thermoplasmatota archaeon]|nr:ribonuclease H-like domain-containing protein [Candidatus Thermoplasmatota archaeon]
MIENSFIFLPRIGEKTELGLWRRGILDWEAYRRRVPEGIGEDTHALHVNLIDHASRALYERQAWRLAALFPNREHWRLWEALSDRAVYVDIETTGNGRWPDITVVGALDHTGVRTFIAGVNLARGALNEVLSKASMLVTFNGSQFDLPLLKQKGVKLPKVPHVDLRFAAARVGLTGGLKAIERELKLSRDPDLDGLSGYDAVLLWRRWERNQDTRALDTLVRYNRADIENLRPLAQEVYARLRNECFESHLPAARRLHHY